MAEPLGPASARAQGPRWKAEPARRGEVSAEMLVGVKVLVRLLGRRWHLTLLLVLVHHLLILLRLLLLLLLLLLQLLLLLEKVVIEGVVRLRELLQDARRQSSWVGALRGLRPGLDLK